jgi:hypothetical protein
MLQVGSTVGALTLCRWLGRHRFFAVTVLFVIAVPVVASIGYAGVTSRSAVIGAAFFAGFCVLGIQSGINVAGALIYPLLCALMDQDGNWASVGSDRSPGLSWLRYSSVSPFNSFTCGRRSLGARRHHLLCDSSPRCGATAERPWLRERHEPTAEAVRQELIDPAWNLPTR